MHARAAHDRRARRIVRLLANAVREDARRVEQDLCIHFVRLAGEVVLHLGSNDLALLVLDQLSALGVVQRDGASRRGRRCQRHTHARVVELAVVVEDGALQPGVRLWVLLRERRHEVHRLNAVEVLGHDKVGGAGDGVVCLEARPVVRHLPPLVARRHDGQRVRQVRHVGQEVGALVQRLEHELELAGVGLEHSLLKVANTSVHQLGGL
mmetsp:Transcript_24433/g.72451  ORF Transcript_24433/g.72451 Transcript_24433/m.72451 type:complete len:209 (-) Transcript_24433:409-1035(-)